MIKLNGSEASRFNGYMNHHVLILFQPESHQSDKSSLIKPGSGLQCALQESIEEQ